MLLFIGLSVPINGQFFYGTRQTYGKNRVQFTEFDWVYHRFDRYDVHFYKGNDALAAQVARMAEKQLVNMENLLDEPVDERIQILVFNNLTDLKQSNVNGNSEDDYNATGITRLSGRRLFLHFNGNYVDLERELRAAMAEIVLSKMVYGSFTQSIRNSALLNLPEWYTEGLISYVSFPRNEEIDTWTRDTYFKGKLKKMNSFMGDDARRAGHSIWNYLVEVYGRKVLKNVVYLSIVNRNIESGFLYILGKDLNSVVQDWNAYLKEKYESYIPVKELEGKPLVKAPKGYEITQMARSRNGKYLAYVCQRFSRYQVFLHDFEKGKTRTILTDGYRIAQNSDKSYPVMAWHPNGEILAMFTEKKGDSYLNFYRTDEKKWQEKTFYRFDKVLSFEYSRDGKRLAVSGIKKGQSDIFIYTVLNTKIEQLTNDTYADLNPTWIENDTRIAFASNRPNAVLAPKSKITKFPEKDLDLFVMPSRAFEDTTYIWQLTNTPLVNENNPSGYGNGYVAFTGNYNFLKSRRLIKIDSSIAFVDTATHYEYNFSEYKLDEFNRDLIKSEYNAASKQVLDLVFYKGRHNLFVHPYRDVADLERVDVPSIPNLVGKEPGDTANKNSHTSNQTLYYPGSNPNDFEIDIYDYQFEGKPKKAPKSDPELQDILPKRTVEVANEEEEELEIPPKRNAIISFYRDDFTVGFDNVFDNNQYQSYTGFVSSDLLNSGFNMNLKLGVMDLMHDYRVTAGFRSGFQPLEGTSLVPNSEFILAVSNLKERLDKHYIFSRRSKVEIFSNENYRRVITNDFNVKGSYPFNPVASLRGSVGYRIDQFVQLSRGTNSLEEPNSFKDYLVARGSFVYDNTRKLGLNQNVGLRYKVFGEYYRNLYKSETGLYTAGFDARNYTRVHRNIIWANRLAAGTSWGAEKLIYIMGGVDNDFSPTLDPTTPMADNNYIFQTLATNMRGFYQNVRNGNSFAVFNSELRVPVFSYLLNKPIRNDFIRNLMAVGFVDAGTAWNGPSPYDKENAINTRTIPFGPGNSNAKVVLDSKKDPIVVSYGVGAHFRLFGYYIRMDWAWPVEDGIVLPNEFSVSLGLDF